MDFFEAQERARRTTVKLVFFYLMAVIMMIVAVYLVALVVFGYAGDAPPDASLTDWVWKPELLLTVSTILLMLILTGSFYRILQLRKGGSAVAEMLGGRKVEPSTKVPRERQLLNVVEEMSIASGQPVPDIYVLDDEENINAFAAGFTGDDAAVGVTQGALKKLSRDELQGVIAHEFSHIFHGDMRLNIRLIGILNGILLLHLMGMIVMRSAAFSRMGRGGGRGGGQAALAMLVFGLALLIIGYVGMLFGRIIQAAISRQREYLADAAAVQYTRNPDGLAGALRKIGQDQNGSKINDGHSMEMSHLFFSTSYYSALDSLFATHPPLNMRIQALGTAFDEEDQKKKARLKKRLETERISRKQSERNQKDGRFHHSAALLAAIGTVDQEQIKGAQALLEEIPQKLREAAHEPFDAEALIIALLLAGREPSATKVPEWFSRDVDPKFTRQAQFFLDQLIQGKREWFLPLAELAIPALKQMSDTQYREFRINLEKLIRGDNQFSFFEFVMEKMITHKLDPVYTETRSPKIRHHHFKTLGDELSILISAMAHASDGDTEEAWKAGVSAVEDSLPEGVQLLASNEFTWKNIDKALDELAASANPVKKAALKALIQCISSDDQISVRERELIRVISEVIHCPIPLNVL